MLKVFLYMRGPMMPLLIKAKTSLVRASITLLLFVSSVVQTVIVFVFFRKWLGGFDGLESTIRSTRFLAKDQVAATSAIVRNFRLGFGKRG